MAIMPPPLPLSLSVSLLRQSVFLSSSRITSRYFNMTQVCNLCCIHHLHIHTAVHTVRVTFYDLTHQVLKVIFVWTALRHRNLTHSFCLHLYLVLFLSLFYPFSLCFLLQSLHSFLLLFSFPYSIFVSSRNRGHFYLVLYSY